jgi:hypothetical protein
VWLEGEKEREKSRERLTYIIVTSSFFSSVVFDYSAVVARVWLLDWLGRRVVIDVGNWRRRVVCRVVGIGRRSSEDISGRVVSY